MENSKGDDDKRQHAMSSMQVWHILSQWQLLQIPSNNIVVNRKATILAKSKGDKVSNMEGATMWMHRSLEL